MEEQLAAMPWPELKSILGDLEVLLEAHEESSVLRSIRALREEMDALLLGREAKAQATIRELTRRVAAAEAEASQSLPSLDEMRARLAVLDRKKAALAEEITRLRGAKEVSSSQLASLTQQLSALKQAMATLTADHTAQVPRVKHSLSLYANVSSIRWDYESEDIAGYIAPPGGAPVRPFCVLAGTDPYDVADRLWAAIGHATGV